jgi:hypothetical protein
MKSSLLIFIVPLVAFGQTSGSGIPVPNPPAVPQFTQLVVGTVYDQLYGWRAAFAGLLPVSKGFWFAVTALVSPEHLNDPNTGTRVMSLTSTLYAEGYKSLYTGHKFSAWIGSGLRVNISNSGQVQSLNGSTGLNPPISTMVRYAISSKWSVDVGTRTTYISPPNGSTAKGWWDFALTTGIGYDLPKSLN